MASHAAHPDTITHGLADGCERCDEHAETGLWSLDGEHLGAFWRKMIEVERDDRGRYRSDNEGVLCAKLREHWVFLQRYVPDVDPETWPIRARAS